MVIHLHHYGLQFDIYYPSPRADFMQGRPKTDLTSNTIACIHDKFVYMNLRLIR